MPSPGTWDWKLINSFASWLSALGTLAAVIVALYLANRDRQIHLEIVAGIRLLLVEGQNPNKQKRYVSISVTNVGRRVAKITGFAWKPLPFKKSGFWIIPPRNVLSTDLPVTLRDGEMANYLVTPEEFHTAGIHLSRDTLYPQSLTARA